MSTVVKDLGAVSAYAYAAEKGYTGTEAEFAELMADYAEVGQRAEDAAESALNSKTAAQTAATTATNKASEATTAAQTATTKAGEAQTSAQTASNKASEASQSASQASGYAQTAETAKTDAQTAKTQAETARDNAVTAKTAAETAQGKAEDAQAAAESVAESIPSDYSQLSEDVSDLKEDLNDVLNAVEVPINKTYSGDAIASLNPIKISRLMLLRGGHVYTYTITLQSASEMPVYVHLRNASDTSVNSLTLNAGDLTKSKVYTPAEDIEVYIVLIDVNRAVSYTITIADVDSNDRIDRLQGTINEIKSFTGETDGLTFTEKAYINTPSVGGTVDTTPTTLNGCACASVACQKGDIFTLYGTPRANSGTRPYMWVNTNGRCVYRSEQTEVFDGEEIVAPYDGTLVVNFLMSSDYAVYKGIRNLHGHIIENIDDIKSIVNSPLETLPEYITNDLAYKPLGQLQHPYLCLSCDDGSAELETYTIPMLLNKNVPCTFGLWSTSSKYSESPVFSPSVILRTQSGIDAVVNAVSHGCEVAQHGTVEWTELTEAELNDFFDREQVAFTNMGITVKGAICPSHCVNNKVRAIAGGRFGSVRSGYNGFKSKEDQQNHIAGDVFAPYGCLTGARSNCYSYTSFNTIDKTLTELKAILDNAIANNMCMIVYWHDWDLTASQKADLEAFIDYAKTTAVNFCTLSEIPTLT